MKRTHDRQSETEKQKAKSDPFFPKTASNRCSRSSRRRSSFPRRRMRFEGRATERFSTDDCLPARGLSRVGEEADGSGRSVRRSTNLSGPNPLTNLEPGVFRATNSRCRGWKAEWTRSIASKRLCRKNRRRAMKAKSVPFQNETNGWMTDWSGRSGRHRSRFRSFDANDATDSSECIGLAERRRVESNSKRTRSQSKASHSRRAFHRSHISRRVCSIALSAEGMHRQNIRDLIKKLMTRSSNALLFQYYTAYGIETTSTSRAQFVQNDPLSEDGMCCRSACDSNPSRFASSSTSKERPRRKESTRSQIPSFPDLRYPFRNV